MNFDTEQLDEVMSQDSEGTEDTEVNEQEAEREPQVLDLDKLERFRWGEKELTPKDLKNMVLMRDDYTRKTQELSEARKYVDNLDADLEAVRGNPQLAEKFKEIYPEKFHKYLNYAGLNSQKPQGQNQKEVKAEEDRLAKLESRLNNYEKEQYQKQVSMIEREIDAEINKALSQYKDVFKTESLKSRFEIDCITLAKQMHDEGVNLNSEVWSKITRHVADDLKSLSGVARSDVITKQKAANAQARDIASGGGIQGQAPKKMGSLREAMKAVLEGNEF